MEALLEKLSPAFFEAYDTANLSQFAIISGDSAFGGLPVVLSTGNFTPSPINVTDSVVGIAWGTGSEYRVTLVVEYLGWVDLDLGSSIGWWAATVGTYCPSRMVEYPKSKSTQPRYSTTRVTL